MEQYLVEYRINDTQLISADDEAQAKTFVVEDIVMSGDYTTDDIEIISVRKLD